MTTLDLKEIDWYIVNYILFFGNPQTYFSKLLYEILTFMFEPQSEIIFIEECK